MTKPKLSVINGSRGQIERDLVEALFGTDEAKITRLVNLLNEVGNKQAHLSLIKNRHSEPKH